MECIKIIDLKDTNKQKRNILLGLFFEDVCILQHVKSNTFIYLRNCKILSNIFFGQNKK